MTTGDYWKPVAIDKKPSREMLIIEKKKKRVEMNTKWKKNILPEKIELPGTVSPQTLRS